MCSNFQLEVILLWLGLVRFFNTHCNRGLGLANGQKPSSKGNIHSDLLPGGCQPFAKNPLLWCMFWKKKILSGINFYTVYLSQWDGLLHLRGTISAWIPAVNSSLTSEDFWLNYITYHICNFSNAKMQHFLSDADVFTFLWNIWDRNWLVLLL